MILTDSGYWLALANPKHRHHRKAIQVSAAIEDDLAITWPVITEASHLLLTRLGHHSPMLFLRQVKANVTIFQLNEVHLERMSTFMEKYRELPMDLADASLVIAAEELGHGNILSTDRRHFQTYRWKNREPFHNLLFPDD
jgi:predicted nucleic acid-binding protein